MVPEVVYLGQKIDAEGLHPVANKVDAIQAASVPKNVSELKSYVGLTSYYRKFLSNLSTLLVRLYRLLRLSTKWKWARMNSRHSRLQRSCLFHPEYVLVHYNPQQELTLACDASPYGVGAVLSHCFTDGSERLTGFASRTLSQAELKYSQIEKEGVKRTYRGIDTTF